MSFPLISYKNLDTWIPSTDADEIDVPNNVLTDMQGINFRNGYIETAIAPDTTTNPTEIQDDIDAGYELLSAKGFTHSSKGNTTVYILYKYDSAHLVKIWLTGAKPSDSRAMARVLIFSGISSTISTFIPANVVVSLHHIKHPLIKRRFIFIKAG